MTTDWHIVPGTIAGTVLGAYLFSKLFSPATRKLEGGISRERQAIEIKGQPGVYKSGILTDENVNLVEKYYDDVNTLYDAFQRGKRFCNCGASSWHFANGEKGIRIMQESSDGPCLGECNSNGVYEFIKYSKVEQKAVAISAFFCQRLQLATGDSTHIGIYSRNCPEWFISALGIMQQSMVIVPLYDTLGPEAAAFIVNQTEMSLIIVDSVKKMRSLMEDKSTLPTLKYIICIDEKDWSEDDEKKAASQGIEIFKFNEVVREGEQLKAELLLPKRENTYIICYTSGTTGTPKGVVLTHRNIVANLSGWLHLIHTFEPDVLDHKQSHISYLPLSHMMEQMTHWNMLIFGASIGYFRGSIQGLTDDIKALQPSVFPVVPRLLNRLYDTIHSKVAKSGWLGQRLFSLAYNRKLQMLKAGITTRNSIWDKLVFAKIQNELGGRVNCMATGSAPISAEVLETCRVTLGAQIVEAYGQTECTAFVTCTWPGDWMGGHCGGPAPCAIVKLADVAELNYYAKDGKGEIMVKGPSITSGYYKNEEKTAELFDSEGFVHTGDIGQMLPNGTIKIIDRAKHIFKLAQGEYVAPEKIEQVYIRTPAVQQIYVDGDSLQRWLIAVVVVEPQVLLQWNKENGAGERSLEDICKDEQAEEYVIKQLQIIGKENKLNSIEQVKRVFLTTEAFSVENDLLTPTLKAKRPNLHRRFKPIMDEIYRKYPNL